MARDLCIEDVVHPFRHLAIDRERFDRTLLMSHLCAYRLAGTHARGKRMLEIGCGTGYGAFYLGHLAHEVVAIDLDTVQVEQARRWFPRENVSYLPMEATQLTFPDHAFDVVGSFQVIEHIPEPQLLAFLSEVSRVLTPEGVFVVSTLNLQHNLKAGKTTYQKPSFHEKEFLPEELRALLRQVFPLVEMSGLYPRPRYRVYRRLKRWGLDRWGAPTWNPVKRFFATLRTDDHTLKPCCTSQAIDLIAICRKRCADAKKGDGLRGGGITRL